jgi:hypothetical protein
MLLKNLNLKERTLPVVLIHHNFWIILNLKIKLIHLEVQDKLEKRLWIYLKYKMMTNHLYQKYKILNK